MATREGEWYALHHGPQKLRMLVNLSFWPYTAMNVSYTVIGSMLAPAIHWEGVGVIALVYLFGLGISAHALDARAPSKPWGQVLSSSQLLALALAFFVLAVSIGVYYVLVNRLVLIWPVGLAEIFFLFAYNMELFNGRFHSDSWFAISWGLLPILAGYFFQTDILSVAPFVMSFVGAFTAYVEISASRPYRALKKELQTYYTQPFQIPRDVKMGEVDSVVRDLSEFARRYESILKSIVASTTLLAVALVVLKL